MKIKGLKFKECQEIEKFKKNSEKIKGAKNALFPKMLQVGTRKKDRPLRLIDLVGVDYKFHNISFALLLDSLIINHL